MLDEICDQISQAILYEGYLFYEQQHLAGNRQKLNVGTLVPRTSDGLEAERMRTECLARGTEQTVVDVQVRFFCRRADDAVEERMNVPRSVLGVLTGKSRRLEFALFPERKILANIEVSAEKLAEGHFKIVAQVQNLSALKNSEPIRCEETMRHSMFAVHTFLHLEAGEFVSLLTPPKELSELPSRCNSFGTQPVLCGKNGERTTMLSSPFVRRDYPEVLVENLDEPILHLHPDWLQPELRN